MENYFKYNKVQNDEAKNNTTMLYVTEMPMLWWKREESEMEGLCIIDTWEQFRTKFKKALFPNNVIYEPKHKFKELKRTGSIRACVKLFTNLTPQSPSLTDEDMLFHFMDGLQN